MTIHNISLNWAAEQRRCQDRGPIVTASYFSLVMQLERIRNSNALLRVSGVSDHAFPVN